MGCCTTLEKNNNEGWFNMAYINTDPTNVNQICFCGKPLTKVAQDCHVFCKCCCKKYHSKDMRFYACQSQCIYRKTSANNYIVCAKCYETQPDIPTDDNENEHSFMKRKIEETLNIIKKEIKQCQNNQQRRQY
eukprot:100998_1